MTFYYYKISIYPTRMTVNNSGNSSSRMQKFPQHPVESRPAATSTTTTTAATQQK